MLFEVTHAFEQGGKHQVGDRIELGKSGRGLALNNLTTRSSSPISMRDFEAIRRHLREPQPASEEVGTIV